METVDLRWLVASRWWHGALATLIAASLAIRLLLIFAGGSDVDGLGLSGFAGIPIRLARLFSYFTVASNIAVAIVCVLLVVDPLRSGRRWEIARLNSLIAISMTGLIFLIVLAPRVHPSGWALVAAIGFHYVSPAATVLGWLLFGPRPRFGWRTLASAFILPISWLVYIFVQGSFTRWYPYAFFNVTTIGLGRALVNAAFAVVVAIAVALIFKLIDARVPSRLPASRVRDAETTNTGG